MNSQPPPDPAQAHRGFARSDLKPLDLGKEEYAEFGGLPPLTTEPRRVLLLVPPGGMDNAFGQAPEGRPELPPLGIGYIAASLRDQGHQVRVLDCAIEGMDRDGYARALRDFRPHMVGMTSYTNNMSSCLDAARTTKEADRGITVVLGGPQVTIFPMEGLDSPDVDVVVLSEGEVVVRNLMNALGDEEALARVRGIWYRAGDGSIRRNEPEALVRNVEILPSPALDLFRLEKYRPAIHVRGRRVIQMMTSRGCPFSCTFCNSKLALGRRFRFYPVERILDDVADMVRLGYDGIQFYDSTFTVNRQHIMDLCQGMLERRLRVQWTCMTRANLLDDELAAMMKKAGCYLVALGCESGSDRLLKIINKRVTVAENAEGIRILKRNGLIVQSFFMLGLPGETREETMQTIRFALEHDVDIPLFWITEPIPGTELWNSTREYGYFDESGRFFNDIVHDRREVWVPNGRTREELEAMANQAWVTFYRRPRAVWRAFQNILHLPPDRALRFAWAGARSFWRWTKAAAANRG